MPLRRYSEPCDDGRRSPFRRSSTGMKRPAMTPTSARARCPRRATFSSLDTLKIATCEFTRNVPFQPVEPRKSAKLAKRLASAKPYSALA